jgi:hypothetical protein
MKKGTDDSCTYMPGVLEASPLKPIDSKRCQTLKLDSTVSAPVN